jgi:hypothetical protein
MPNCDWKRCAVCGGAFAGAEYLQVIIESSKRIPGTRPRFLQVVADAEEDVALLYLTRQWYCGGWMKTRAVCLPCVASLPPAWRALFARADLSDWIPVRRLDSGDESSDTETWLVREKEKHADHE